MQTFLVLIQTAFRTGEPLSERSGPKARLGVYAVVALNSVQQLGLIVDVDRKKDAVRVQFMKRLGSGNSFQWSETPRTEWVATSNLHCTCSPPNTKTGRVYEMVAEDYEKTFLCPSSGKKPVR